MNVSAEKRHQFAGIIYLLPENRFRRLRLLILRLPEARWSAFADKLESTSYRQLDHYVRILGITKLTHPLDNFHVKYPTTSTDSITNWMSMPTKVELTVDKWVEM